MKSITINGRVIYFIIAIVFVAYCYFSYQVFTASNSPALINGDSTDAEGNINTTTLSQFFSNLGILNVITPVIVLLLIILIFFDSS